jgi:putative transposase
VQPDLRDEVVDFVNTWAQKTAIKPAVLVRWTGVPRSTFATWRRRYGRANEHNGWIVRDHYLLAEERQAIVGFARAHPSDGYRRLTYMMIDADLVAVSPATVYRVLKAAGLLKPWACKTRTRGKGFEQPASPHEHWHIDVSYINVSGTFYYLASVLDGFSRSIVAWTLRESMTVAEIELLVQQAKDTYPQARPRIISDNGPQFIARDFKELIRLLSMTHVTTSPGYPQSNGKIERWHGTLKSEAIRCHIPISLEDARRIVADFVHRYNCERLHSAIGYVTPCDMLEGRREQIHRERDRKLEAARQARRERRLTLRTDSGALQPGWEKRKRALEESNPPGISRPGGQPHEELEPKPGSSTPPAHQQVGALYA